MGRKSTYRFPFASLPALRISIFLIAGILMGHYAEPHLSLSAIIGIFTGVFILWALLEFRNGQRINVGWVAANTMFYSLMIILFGAGLFLMERAGKEELLMHAASLSLYEWEEVRIRGTIEQRGTSSSGREIYGVAVEETIFEGTHTWHQPYWLRIYGSEKISFPTNHNRLDAVVRLYAFPEKRNPHEFDYGAWLISQSFAAHGDIQRVISSEAEPGFSWQSIRNGVFSNIEKLFDAKSVPLAKALLTGYKDELTASEKSAFSRSGLSHIMAVSGMHVGFVVAPFWVLIPWLWKWRWGKITGIIALTFLLISYAGLTGFSASVSRASIMAWLLTYGKLFHKIRHSVNLLACAALILLVIRPSQLFDVGFQLSFSAVLIILLLMPEAQNLIPERYRFDWRGGLISIIIISVIVQVGLFPILTTYFGEFSIIGPLANAMVVPVLSIVVPAGLLVSILGGFVMQPALLIARPLEVALNWIAYVADNLGGNEFSYITFTDSTPWILLLWAFGITLCASIRIPTIRWKMVALFLMAANICLADVILSGRQTTGLTVTVLDVGQGDAIHIETPGGKNMMIDMGRWSPGGNSGEEVILPYLEYKGVNKLDAVLLSHPHADHIGGLPSVLESVQIDTIYQSDYEYDSNLYRRYMQLAQSKKIPVKHAEAGEMIHIDPAIRIFVLAPGKVSDKSHNVNDHSLAFRLAFGESSFLFTGDAETRQEEQIARKYGDFLDADFLKVGHHGSKTSSTEHFINKVKPDIAVVSLAFRNRFGHPNREAVTNLHSTGAKKYFTSLSGALIFRSDGQTISPICD